VALAVRGPLRVGRGWLAQVEESLSMLLVARGSGRCGGFAQTACAHRDIDIGFNAFLSGRAGVPYVCVNGCATFAKWTCQYRLASYSLASGPRLHLTVHSFRRPPHHELLR